MSYSSRRHASRINTIRHTHTHTHTRGVCGRGGPTHTSLPACISTTSSRVYTAPRTPVNTAAAAAGTSGRDAVYRGEARGDRGLTPATRHSRCQNAGVHSTVGGHHGVIITAAWWARTTRTCPAVARSISAPRSPAGHVELMTIGQSTVWFRTEFNCHPPLAYRRCYSNHAACTLLRRDAMLARYMLLAAEPLDTRPCISRFALGPGFVCRKVTT